MSGWAAAAQVAAQIADKGVDYLIDKNSRISKDFAGQLRMEQYRREDTKYRRAVRDAKAAGLHPLFALGTGMSASPATHYQTPGPGSTGGLGLSDAVRTIQRGKEDSEERAMMRELHALDVKAREQQIQMNELDLRRTMMRDSQNMKLQQELMHSPQRAEAFTEAAAQRHRVEKLQQDLMDQLAVRTGKGGRLVAPGGGVYNVPEGITPQETWETLIGDAADWLGYGIGGRMVLQDWAEKAQKGRSYQRRRPPRRSYRKGPRRNW